MNAPHWWIVFDRIGFHAAAFLLSALWQSTLLFLAVATIGFALRRRRSSARHALWFLALVIAPVLPLCASGAKRLGTPQAPVAMLPSYSASAPSPQFLPPPGPPLALAPSTQAAPSSPTRLPRPAACSRPRPRPRAFRRHRNRRENHSPRIHSGRGLQGGARKRSRRRLVRLRQSGLGQ